MNREAYDQRRYRVIANQGSTRSGKTYSLAQLLALYIPHKEKVSISIVSPSLPHLKRGARRDVLEILEKAGLYSDEAFNKTDNIYNYPNGSYIEFFGAEDAGKVRGPGRDILYINEANLLSQSIYQQLAFRTRKTIFLDFNPVDESSWVYDVADKEGNLLIHSTYKDNPFLPIEQVNEIESLQYADANLWKVYGLGERGKSLEIIYTHWKLGEFQEGELVYGLDFGYSVPTALVKVSFKDKKTFVEEVIYQTKLTTNDLIERMKDLGINGSVEIFCDNAEPKTIEELTRAGFNAKPASKDVYAGIQKVKAQDLYISPGSVNLLKEIRSYRWKVDKDGKVHQNEEPVKMWDHLCDAMRYAIYTKLNKLRFQIMAW
jgi:phage terminase large subunit